MIAYSIEELMQPLFSKRETGVVIVAGAHLIFESLPKKKASDLGIERRKETSFVAVHLHFLAPVFLDY